MLFFKKKSILSILFLSINSLLAQNIEFKSLNLFTTDFEYAPSQERIYVAVKGTSPQFSNSVCKINPYFGSVEASIFVAGEPVSLAISDDDQYLYVALSTIPKILRINLRTFKVEKEIPTNIPDLDTQVYPREVIVMQGKPKTIISTLTIGGIFPHATIVYDDSIPRTKYIDYTFCTNLMFGIDSTIVLGNNHLDNRGINYFQEMKIIPTGIELTKTVKGNLLVRDRAVKYHKDDNLYYTEAGRKMKLVDNFLISIGEIIDFGYSGTYPFFFDSLGSNIAYFFDTSIKFYDRSNLKSISSIGLGNHMNGAGSPLKILNWGTKDKWILSTQNKLLISRNCTSNILEKPIINEGRSIDICLGSTINLNAAPKPNDKKWTLRWSTGDTSSTIKINKEGNYFLTYMDSTGCLGTASDVTTVTLQYKPTKPFVPFNHQLEICRGETIAFTADTFANIKGYLWSNGEMSRTINVNASGAYSVAVISNAGCQSDFSFPYRVSVKPFDVPPTPILTSNKGSSICAGEQISLTAPVGYKEYMWSNGSIQAHIDLTPQYSDSFNVVVKTSEGCASKPSNWLKIEVKRIPDKPTIIFESGILYSTINYGQIQWFLNEDTLKNDTLQYLKPLKSGFYSVQSTVENCKSHMSNLYGYTLSGINNPLAMIDIEVFPNPTLNTLNISSAHEIIDELSLYDALGKLILTVKPQSLNHTIDLENLPVGIYQLKGLNKKSLNYFTKKIIKF